jgi:hypothetical protein
VQCDETTNSPEDIEEGMVKAKVVFGNQPPTKESANVAGIPEEVESPDLARIKEHIEGIVAILGQTPTRRHLSALIQRGLILDFSWKNEDRGEPRIIRVKFSPVMEELRKVGDGPWTCVPIGKML